jgi:hypothetical protein
VLDCSRHGIPRLINPKCSVLWFPETHMDGPEVDELAQGIDRLASGATFGRHDVTSPTACWS